MLKLYHGSTTDINRPPVICEFFDGVAVAPADEVDSAREYELIALG